MPSDSEPSSADLRPSATSANLIRVSLGIIYFHFGYLKFFPDLSPAEVLAGYTSQILCGYSLDSATVLLIVAVLECVIGLGFLLNVGMRWVALLFFFHMAATFLPLFVLPEFAFKFPPFAPTIEGQYIIKNLVLASAGWAVFSPHFRGFRLPFSRQAQPAGDAPQPSPAP
ncbi:MAG: DoxX family protein [Verrucomicrobiales bacterium]